MDAGKCPFGIHIDINVFLLWKFFDKGEPMHYISAYLT